jgi:hypothetical protein
MLADSEPIKYATCVSMHSLTSLGIWRGTS